MPDTEEHQDKHVEDILSHTEDEDEEEEDDDGIEEQPIGNPPTMQYPGNVIPDNNIEEIEADQDLTADIELDTDYIDLVHLKISSLEDLHLERFKNLQSLCLRQNLITSIVAVKEISDKLEELDLYDNRINHISSSIGHLVNLKTLDFSFNRIKNIKNIENLINIEQLFFVQNKIKEIKNIENLTKLRMLELGANKIERIENLEPFINLQSLFLGSNRILKLEGLDTLVNLKVLSIQSNGISKIENLDKLKNLEELYLTSNRLSEIEGLENLENLQILDLSHNKISKLDNLGHLQKLEDLWISSNLIESFNEVDKLSKLESLETVYLEHNPIQLKNATSYRRKVKLALPNLKKLDATYFS